MKGCNIDVEPGEVKTWETLAIKDDMWILTHRALTLDMTDTSNALQALITRAGKGENVADDVDKVATWFNTFFKPSVQSHHNMEENVIIPILALTEDSSTRTDHRNILVRLAHISDMFTAYTTSRSVDDLLEIQASFHSFVQLMASHFADEEAMIPTLRSRTTRSELGAKMKSAMSSGDWFALPQVLRPLNPEGMFIRGCLVGGMLNLSVVGG